MSGENAISIVGWGNQGRAWAANLHDSQYKVNVLLRKNSHSRSKLPDWVKAVDIEGAIPEGPIAFLIPDHEIAKAVQSLAPRLKPNTILLYAHGYALMDAELDKKFPEFNHVLLAPKAIGSEVRATYLDKRALGGVYSVEKIEESKRRHVEGKTLELARDLGITMGPYACTVRQETVADLFSEQAVLCSIIPEACRIAFEMLRARGIPSELAFFELWHEVGLIVKVMVDKGPEAFFNLISPNALIGAEKGREILCDAHFKQGMEKLLTEIEDGTFQKEVLQSDVSTIRAETLKRWKGSELSATVERLYKGNQ